jgi:hypothetical protein
MSRTVVFLGAGASKALGLPLTNEILPALLERLKAQAPDGRELFGGSQQAAEHLTRCLEAILPGLRGLLAGSDDHGRWTASLPPITDILSAIDYSLLSGNSPGAGLTLRDLEQSRRLLERAIFELLSANVSTGALEMDGVPDTVSNEWREAAARRVFPTKTVDQGMELRQKLVAWLQGLVASGHQVTLISTNYDIEVEQELYNQLGYREVFHRVDFGTSVRDPDSGIVHPRPNNAPFAVLKLHGSLRACL